MDRTTRSRHSHFDTPADRLPSDRAPLVPEALLRQHACFLPGDTRYRSSSRLRQALLRQDLGLEPGLHRPGGTSTAAVAPRGSLLTPADAARGVNFITPQVHAHTRHSLTFREEGACVSVDRLMRNMLSSESLVRNAFVPLALDLNLTTRVFSQLLPDFVHRVDAVRFEMSPSRDRTDPRYLGDGTAFDAALSVIYPDGETATVSIEVKYTEACQGPPARHRARYDAASREIALHHDPDARALRRDPQGAQRWPDGLGCRSCAPCRGRSPRRRASPRRPPASSPITGPKRHRQAAAQRRAAAFSSCGAPRILGCAVA